MQELFNIFVKSIFIDNMVFAYFLGMCSYLAVSKTVNTSFGLGIAVVFVLGITVPVDYLINHLPKIGNVTFFTPKFESILDDFPLKAESEVLKELFILYRGIENDRITKKNINVAYWNPRKGFDKTLRVT